MALLESIQQHAILQPHDSSTGINPLQQQQQLLQLVHLPEVQQLLLWQGCLDSLDAAALIGPCGQQMFAYNLLAGALKAFSYSYMAVRCTW